MTREEPIFTKCCFFIPLRFCLQTWACIKMVVDVLAIVTIVYFVIVSAILYGYNTERYFGVIAVLYFIAMLIMALIADVVFLIIFIAGIFKKSVKVLRMFFFYEIYAMTAEAAVIALVCVNVLQVHTSLGIIYTIIGVLYILLDLCICLTVYSEMTKLKNKEQYIFSKMPADDEVNGKFKVEEE